jgi:hypothetical protein
MNLKPDEIHSLIVTYAQQITGRFHNDFDGPRRTTKDRLKEVHERMGQLIAELP